jgi:S-DNA-T family DNA segregation ATPase FtsK/SpoIIIE
MSIEQHAPQADETFTAAIRHAWEASAAAVRNGLVLARMRTPWMFHQVLRGLKALVKLAFVYSWRGLARLVARLAKWVYDSDSAELRHMHAGNRDSGEYARVHMVRRANLHARMLVFGTIAAVLVGPLLAWTFPYVLSAIAGLVVLFWTVKVIPGRDPWEIVAAVGVGVATWWFLPEALALLPRPPGWVWPTAGAVALVVFGLVGRPMDKPILKQTVLPAGVVPPLRAPMVTEALCQLGNSKMKEPDQIRLLMDVARQGPGYQVDLELPPAVPATFVQKHREEFAAALRRELGTVWPSVGKRHPGHLSLFVSDQPMAQQTQERWPLLHGGEVDLGRPFPAFTDQRGDWVEVTLAYANMIIGAVPRMGKTFVLREFLLAAGLDKRAKVYALDGKGTGDLAPCALYAHGYVRGARTDKPEQIEKVRAIVRELRRELGRRADIIDSLPHEECPESKVTSELIKARPDLDLGWIVLGIDETQSFFGYGDKSNREHKAIREEITAGVTELVKMGPAAGMIVVLATQQVKEETIPSSIAQNAVIRFCLKIEGHEPNDRILGTGAYRRGIDAQMFDLDDKGIGYLKADGEGARIVRSVFGLDAPTSEKVAARARALRAAAGTLTGDAVGEEAAEEALQVDLLEDVRFVMDNEEGAGRMHLAAILPLLTLLRPKLYGHMDAEGLGSALREAGVRVGQVKVGGRNTSGVRREWLDVAATADESGPDDDIDDGDEDDGEDGAA